MVDVFLLTAEPTFSYFYNWLDERTNEIKIKYIAAEFTKEKNIILVYNILYFHDNW